MRRLPWYALALLAAGCGGDSPYEANVAAGPLRLEASVSRPVIMVGDTTSLTFRLVNTTAASVEIVFPGGCFLLAFIRQDGSDDIVYPEGGGWACTTALTALRLAAGEAHLRTVPIRGGARQQAIYSDVPLPAGRYRAYARVPHPDYPLRSELLSFEVR